MRVIVLLILSILLCNCDTDIQSLDPVVDIESAAGVGSDHALDAFRFDKSNGHHWFLPDDLREISGLAITPDDRLFAHNDEEAVVFEINYFEGAFNKIFWLGDVPVLNDFEGIAVTEDYMYLVTSTGVIYRFKEGVDAQSVEFETFRTELADICEVEGLSYFQKRRQLLLLCKRMIGNERSLPLYTWSIDKQILEEPLFYLDESYLAALLDKKHFRPSGVKVNMTTGTIYIIAARQRAIIEMSEEGTLLTYRFLPKNSHRQVEGITVLSNGNLVLGAEGSKKAAKLDIYETKPSS